MKGNSTPTADQAKVRVLVADDHPVVRHGIIANVKPQPTPSLRSVGDVFLLPNLAFQKVGGRCLIELPFTV